MSVYIQMGNSFLAWIQIEKEEICICHISLTRQDGANILQVESSEGTEMAIPCLKYGQISDVQTEKMEVGVSQAF